MSEQRRDPRVKAKKPIWLEGQENLQAQTKNLSKGGMFILAQGDSPQIGQQLEIKMEDAEEGEVALKMEVVWRSEDSDGSAGLGLRALGSEGREAFERIVSRHIDAGDEIVAETPPKKDE